MNSVIKHTIVHEKILKNQDAHHCSLKSKPETKKASNFLILPNGMSKRI